MEFAFNVDGWMILQLFVLPVLLPLLVGLVTRFETSSARKALLLLALSVLTAFLTSILEAYQSGVEVFDLGSAVLTSLITFVIGVGLHYGLLKPTGASDAVQAIGSTSTH